MSNSVSLEENCVLDELLELKRTQIKIEQRINFILKSKEFKNKISKISSKQGE